MEVAESKGDYDETGNFNLEKDSSDKEIEISKIEVAPKSDFEIANGDNEPIINKQRSFFS